jgi:hypothetical protein
MRRAPVAQVLGVVSGWSRWVLSAAYPRPRRKMAARASFWRKGSRSFWTTNMGRMHAMRSWNVLRLIIIMSVCTSSWHFHVCVRIHDVVKRYQ